MSKYPYLAKVVDASTDDSDPFTVGQEVCILGELTNMPGHLVVATRDRVMAAHQTSAVYFGYHQERFRKLKPDET